MVTFIVKYTKWDGLLFLDRRKNLFSSFFGIALKFGKYWLPRIMNFKDDHEESSFQEDVEFPWNHFCPSRALFCAPRPLQGWFVRVWGLATSFSSIFRTIILIFHEKIIVFQWGRPLNSPIFMPKSSKIIKKSLIFSISDLFGGDKPHPRCSNGLSMPTSYLCTNIFPCGAKERRKTCFFYIILSSCAPPKTTLVKTPYELFYEKSIFF